MKRLTILWGLISWVMGYLAGYDHGIHRAVRAWSKGRGVDIGGLRALNKPGPDPLKPVWVPVFAHTSKKDIWTVMKPDNPASTLANFGVLFEGPQARVRADALASWLSAWEVVGGP